MSKFNQSNRFYSLAIAASLIATTLLVAVSLSLAVERTHIYI